MRSIACVLTGWFAAASIGFAADDPRVKLDTAVPEAIRLLEAKEYLAFLKAFVPPHELKKISDNVPLEDFAKRFGEKKAARLLAVLQAVKDTKPTLDDDGTEATYHLKEETEGKKSITFVKVEKYWYIKN